ncbi:exocyst complex component 7 [Onthophagus taurus]|uniref:exocyst complex component 7 n=1 Tax=Onthophagus taurus TaxID=166361 RepID=UPI0039BE9AE2
MDKRIDIGTKLEKEQSNLNILLERLSKSEQIAKGIDTILNTFENRLSKLEGTILPVYNETDNLHKTKQNIDKTIQLLDNVINYYEISSKVEDIIEKGPRVVTDGGIDLDTYLISLNKLSKAQKYFEKHIPQSVELENVSSLFNKGSDKLNAEFKTILDKHNKPMLPVALMNLINTDEDGGVTDDINILPPIFPDTIKSSLIIMADWLYNNGRDEYLTVYGKIRGDVLQRSLTSLKKYQKSVSGGSVHGTSGSPMLKPKFQSKQESTRRPSTRRLHQVFEKKANRMLLRASQTIEQSTGLNLGGRRASHLDVMAIGEELENEQEMENYLVCVVALHKLMQIELYVMKGIIESTHQARVFELIVKEALDSIVQDGENIAARAKRSISRHDFSSVLVIFPILKQLIALKPKFERTVEECDARIKAKFDSILHTLHSTGVKALEDFIESLRTDSVTQLPPDGTVHELTSNVLMFLEQLLEYTETIGKVLSQDPSYDLQYDKAKTSNKNKVLLGFYIKKVLVQLNHTLYSKSEQYSDPALKAIFRLNNNNYVLKSLQRSNLLELYLIAEPGCEDFYYKTIQDQKNQYSTQSWSKLLNYISIKDCPINIQHGDKLKDKERAFIKEKFAGFNKEIEDVVKVQRGYSIPDVQLRESLKRDNKELILPKYNAFYNYFEGTSFTKNPDKYIKHKPDEVATLFDKIFDVAA